MFSGKMFVIGLVLVLKLDLLNANNQTTKTSATTKGAATNESTKDSPKMVFMKKESSPPERGTSNMGFIGILVFAVIMFLVCCAIIAMYKWHGKPIRKTLDKEWIERTLAIIWKKPNVETFLKEFEIERGGIDVINQIALGAFGIVKGGHLKVLSVKPNSIVFNALSESSTSVLYVAVKQLPGSATEVQREECLNEARIMMEMVRELSFHENIAKFLGACTTAMPYQLVIEYCNMGSLLDTLRNSRMHLEGVLSGQSDTQEVLSLKDLITAAVDICYGMDHMHKHGFVHRDLACRNILLHKKNTANSRIVAKITDFGLTKRVDVHGQFIHNGGGLLPIYLESIEARRDGVYSAASDSWAMGVLLFEMFTYGLVPYAQYTQSQPAVRPNQHELLSFLSTGQRLSIPDYVHSGLRDIMQRCWHGYPSDRPTMLQLSQQLSAHLESLSNEVQNEPLDIYMGSEQLTMDEANYFDDRDDYFRVENLSSAIFPPLNGLPNVEIRLPHDCMEMEGHCRFVELSSSPTSVISVTTNIAEEENCIDHTETSLARDYVNSTPIGNRDRYDSGVMTLSIISQTDI